MKYYRNQLKKCQPHEPSCESYFPVKISSLPMSMSPEASVKKTLIILPEPSRKDTCSGSNYQFGLLSVCLLPFPNRPEHIVSSCARHTGECKCFRTNSASCSLNYSRSTRRSNRHTRARRRTRTCGNEQGTAVADTLNLNISFWGCFLHGTRENPNHPHPPSSSRFGQRSRNQQSGRHVNATAYMRVLDRYIYIISTQRYCPGEWVAANMFAQAAHRRGKSTSSSLLPATPHIKCWPKTVDGQCWRPTSLTFYGEKLFVYYSTAPDGCAALAPWRAPDLMMLLLLWVESYVRSSFNAPGRLHRCLPRQQPGCGDGCWWPKRWQQSP